jgi:valyl-tRNA synthetase
MNIEKIEVDYDLLNKHSDIADKWIFSKLNSTIKNVVNALDKYEINNAVKLVYDFVWKEYCDWYIEIMKNKIAHGSDEQKTAALSKAVYVFEQSLKLLHPFMPFITEELWSYFFSQKNSKSISIDEYPKADDSYIDEAVEKEFEFLQKIVSSIRVIRGENNIHPAKKIDVTIKIDSLNENISSYIKSLAKIENLTFSKNLIKPKLSASAIVDGIELFAPLEGIIDIQAERKRLIKEIEKLEAALIPLQKKLSNRQFVENAPADIVLKEKEKETLWKENLAKLKEALNMLND